ncbi:HNH endonuclease [Acinetobacter sp. ME22]|uniref:HNH endonuclease signature motif containing protein n=1 Tax=Acinetobacter sp. ME22 TaxID=2904802 RepID=UPI001EDBB2F0|nr:HNH endonuclease signature motif containing protein [Acinetobacter sp. ME22]MCG2572371.1 HNH endonuclease [Acinetobacter sp. ME22]
MPKGTRIKYTKEMEDFLHNHTHMFRGEMTKLFNETFGTSISRRVLGSKCERIGALTGRTGRFEKGQPSWNKGLELSGKYNFNGFKPGHEPHNKKPVGYERLTRDGYIEVKVAEPNTFKQKHRHVWEQHHGPIPQTHVIVFKNMDKADCRIENLELITRSELVRLNQLYSSIATPESNETCILLARIKNKTHELRGKA